MVIDATNMNFMELNDAVRTSSDNQIQIRNVRGQRYIGSGLAGKEIQISGIPGNALGSYLNGSTIRVDGNAQDATGDTLNHGAILINGSAGDACGYAMRGGRIFVRQNVGYRAGINMKAYQDHKPVLVVGGKAGDFLGEYQAGGIIIVLGIGLRGDSVGSFCGTGMHGGKIYVRGSLPQNLVPQISAHKAEQEDLDAIREHVIAYGEAFDYAVDRLLEDDYTVLTPNTKNPYHMLYTQN